VNPSDGIAGDCKLDTKPQPQWTSNWLGDSNRNKIYTDWSKMITMKTTEPVFLGTASISNTVLYYRILRLRIMPGINSIKGCFSWPILMSQLKMYQLAFSGNLV
jgi:hypothetical protein